MNLCFIKGKVIEKVEFNFLYREKQISIAKTNILLENGSIVLVKGYDEMADWMYQHIELGDILFLKGELTNNMDVEINWIKKIYQ